MPPGTFSVKDRRWTLRIAPYMAARGIGTIGLFPIVLMYVWLGSKQSFVPIVVVAALSGSVPLVRTLRAGVVCSSSKIEIRNPFRTVTLDRRDVLDVTSAPLWQNLFMVAVIVARMPEGGTRLIKVAGLGDNDVPRLRDAVLSL